MNMPWEVLRWTASVVSVMGAFLISAKHPKRGLEAYSIANVLWIACTIKTCDWPGVFMFSVFLILSVWGRWNWRTFSTGGGN